MMLFNCSAWLLIVVFVNVVYTVNIDETEDSVKTSFISLLKNIVNINEKRIDAMKHIEEEKDFRLGSYLSKIHKVNDDSQGCKTNENAHLSITDMKRNLNLTFRKIYTQLRPVIEDDATMILPFNRFTFKTLKIKTKKKVLKSNNQINELPSGYHNEPSILDMINKKLKDGSQKMNNRIFPKDNDIIVLPKYLSKTSIDNIIAKLIKSEDNNENKNIISEKDDSTIIILSRKYLRRASIQDLIIKIIKLNDSYQKKTNEVLQKEDIIRKLQDTINTLKQTNTMKNQNGNIQRKIVNHNCDDETEGEKKYEDDKKKHTCGISDDKHVKCDDTSKIKPGNVDLVFTFDDGIEAEESQWTDWSYEFAEGEAFSSWENKGNLQNTRKAWRGCGKNAAKSCRSVCSVVHEDICTRYKCIRQAKQAFRKECKRTCTAAFVVSKYSEERL